MNQALRVVIVVFAFVGIFLAGGITGGMVVARHLNCRHQREAKQWQAQQQQQAQVIKGQRQRIQAMQNQQQMLQRQIGMLIAQRKQGQGRGPEQFSAQLMQRLSNQVKPTPEQREQIRPLIFQTAENLRRLRRDTAHQTEVEIERLEDEIAAVLTPEQRDRFDQLVAKWRAAFQSYNQQQQQRQMWQRQQEGQSWPKPTFDGSAPAPSPPSSAPGGSEK